ncbi:putative acetyltransferase [Vulgatibacter incomptus]|uniref:Putative acetyltransferase n=1 Tax=Vulgatibacter incomptus TaxID=1391653 RepID=A0A0K1PBC8_9BACT|nr:putative acetyltransferase [Vulgatibacter incomptus]
MRLVPLRPEHAPELHRLAEPGVLEHYTHSPEDESLEAFAVWMERIYFGRANKWPFAVQSVATGELVGATSFMDIRLDDRALEIGSTWYGRRFQGTTVNPEAKYLQLRHAFEELGMRRVQLKTSTENVQSQRAIEKLGAVREGVLRNYQLRMNGLSRDTVIYSITDTEWPAVKERLEARLRAASNREIR